MSRYLTLFTILGYLAGMNMLTTVDPWTTMIGLLVAVVATRMLIPGAGSSVPLWSMIPAGLIQLLTSR